MTAGRAQVGFLTSGQRSRLHLNDGPIDVIVEAFGQEDEVRSAYRAAAKRFLNILDELCGELPLLRKPAGPDGPKLSGVIARRMRDAVMPYAPDIFITPMAAVAGAVAEEVLGAMTREASLAKAYVNDGGDIALHLTEEQEFTIGMVEQAEKPSWFGDVKLRAEDGVHGIATSGWRGRSFSLGIADGVTVLAETAAAADAAATAIGNAVDLPGHPAIIRVPACDLAPDNDLGSRLVTQGVGDLSCGEIGQALNAGVRAGDAWFRRGLIRAAALRLQGETRTLGTLPRLEMQTLRTCGGLVHA